MTDPLDNFPLPYSLTYKATAGGSFQSIDSGQRQPGKAYASTRHYLGPGVYSISIVSFTAGRAFRVTTSKGFTIFSSVDGWQVNSLSVAVNEGEEEYLMVQTGDTGTYTAAQVAAGARTALNIVQMPAYTA